MNQSPNDTWILNTANSAVDVRTLDSLAQRAGPRTSVRYDRGAGCPQWEKFLLQVFNGDLELISFFQHACGYSLTESTEEQCLFFCYGPTTSGKSTALKVLAEIGGGYARIAHVADLSQLFSDELASTRLAALAGSRMVFMDDVIVGRSLSEATIKLFTERDARIAARYLYSEPFEFTWTAKLWLESNQKPAFTGTDEGIMRRIRMIPFAEIGEDEMDRRLLDKLRGEYTGILRWMLDGANQWSRGGLPRLQRT